MRRALGFSLLILCACGYRFTAGGGALPQGIREVYAPVFINRTAEPGLETLFTQALREYLVRNGVAGTSSSQAQLIGEVLSVSGAPTVLTTSGTLASNRLFATVGVRLVNKGVNVPNGAVTVAGQEEYLPGGNVLESEANRAAALRRLAESLARDAYDRLATR
ncbi:MAG TPA: LptE family protein [Myxococcaceae bacterium]|nr:LptE family protein [Myxococcaceae bacterium]